MTKVDEHRAVLAGPSDWMPYLDTNSGLPGPRGNLEVVAACGEEADVHRAEQLIASGDEFATVCGLVALGRHLAHGDDTHLGILHAHASDGRWRVREGVAMALQRAADDAPARAFSIAERWARGPDPLVRRAAVAALSEPRLLRADTFAARALALIDGVTADLAASAPGTRRSPPVRTLRQALGYGWSVVIAALPAEGLSRFRRLEVSDDPDIAWIVRENRKKARFKRVLADLSL